MINRPRPETILALIVAVVPCFWQPRIAASDVLSHTYNAYLANEISRTGLEGLHLARQSTNVAWDLLLARLLTVWTPATAERVAVAVCVIVFFLGALAFVRSFGDGDERWTLPALAALSNGWVLQQGLLNFYLSTGLALGAVALARSPSRASRVGPLPLAVIAWLANPLPVAWGASVLLFLLVGARWGPARQYLLLGATSVAIAVAVYAPGVGLAALWQRGQLGLITGADQLVTFSAGGMIPASLYLIAVSLGVTGRIERDGAVALFGSPEMRVVAASAACVAVLPVAAGLAGSDQVLSLVPHRMSLLVAVSLVAVVAVSPRRPALRWMGPGLALTFFAVLYTDHARITRAEREVAALVATVPYRARVIDRAPLANTRVIYDHMVDRYCTGHCWSYANYEPSTGQFRVRAERWNPYVLATWEERRQVASGVYEVKPAEVPIYQVEPCAQGAARYCLRQLVPGQPNGGPAEAR